MATAVSHRGGMFRNKSGSLSELDSCGRFVDKYLKEIWNIPQTSHASWSSEHVNNLDENILKSLQIHNESLSVDECLGIRYVLSLLQKKIRHGRVTPEKLNSLSWIIFSSVLQSNREKDDAAECKEPNGFNSHSVFTDREQSKLIGALCDVNIEQILQNRGTFSFLSQSHRRHCISESDLHWTLSDNLLFPVEQTELRQAFSTDFSDAHSLHSNLHTRHGGHENLADLTLFEETESFSEITIERQSNGDEPLVTCSLESTDSIEVVESVKPDCQEYPTDSAEPGSQATFQCGSPPEQETTAFDNPTDENLLTSLSQPIYRSDSNTTAESILSQSSSAVKLPKSVSFADEVGQSLTEVFLIKNEDNQKTYEYDDDFDGECTWPPVRKPRIYPSAISTRFTRSKLKRSQEILFDNLPPITASLDAPNNVPTSPPRYIWCVQFPQPASQYYQFRQRVENGSVSLESITVSQPTNKSDTQLPVLSGTIKVKNISFEKQVWLRLTTDNWVSYTDHMALYNPQLSGAQLHSTCRFDTFTFNVQVSPQLETQEPCEKIEFAIRYVAGMDGSCGQYWDNNDGKNYTIERKILRYTWSNEQHAANTESANSSQFFDGFQNYRSSAASHFNPYTPDYRPNFSGFTQFTDYRAWSHFAGESTYY